MFHKQLGGSLQKGKIADLGCSGERSAMPGCPNKGKVPDCIVIEDDGESEVENEDSHSGAKVHNRKFYSSSAQHGIGDSNRAPPRLSIDSSDEEDCVVVEPNPSRQPSSPNIGVPDAKKRPKFSAHHRYNLKRNSGRPSESSESDVIVDFNGTVRRDWEEAALRKRMGNMFNSSSFRAESEESASVSSHANNGGRQSFISRRQRGDTHHFKNLEHASDQLIAPEVSPAGAGLAHGKEGEDLKPVFDQQHPNPDVLDARPRDATDQPIAPGVCSREAGLAHGKEGEDLLPVIDQQDSNPDVLDAQSGEVTDQPMALGVSPAGAGLTHGKEGEDLQQVFDLQDSNPDVLDARSGDATDQPTVPVPLAGANSTHFREGEGARVASDLHDLNPGVSGAGLTHGKEGEDLQPVFDLQDSNPDVLDARSGDVTDQPTAPGVPLAGANSTHVREGKGARVVSDLHDLNPGVSGAQLDDTVEEAFLAETVPTTASHNVESSANAFETDADGDVFMESSQEVEADVGASGSLGDPHEGSIQDAEAAAYPVNGDSVVNGRERLKETEEFRQAVAEEWARRQSELQKQAQEAIRERKRRKLETERRLDMEVRQKQRLEEIRQSQLKEEQTLDLKEQVRGLIHLKLERMAATCRDMATLLRRLGISVDGGAFPTAQQVNAAYKKALLRFHPDRIAVLVKRDPSHQVESEETFKLISRMKAILPPVATTSFFL